MHALDIKSLDFLIRLSAFALFAVSSNIIDFRHLTI